MRALVGSIQNMDANRIAWASLEGVNPAVAAKLAKWEGGTAEPWIGRIVADIVVAMNAHTVLECGSYHGGTSVFLHDALCRLGRGELHLVEIDPGNLSQTMHAIRSAASVGSPVNTHGHTVDIMQFLRETSDRFDVAWVDDDHDKQHVFDELALLISKMNPNGVILLHDVCGQYDLQVVVTHYGGYSLDIPAVSASGGLGIIQVRHDA